MAHLNDEHVDYIKRDLHFRGIVLDGFDEELIDHICSAVERRMATGIRFIDAYHFVLKEFGHTSGLRLTQKEVLSIENQSPKNMLRNYLKIAFRNLARQRFYSFVNVSGLALGVASCLLIILFILHETGYDRHHLNADRIFRVDSEIKFGANHFNLAVAPAPLADAFLHEFPDVQTAVRFRSYGAYLVKRDGAAESSRETQVVWADSTFFDVFTVPMVRGNGKMALRLPGSVAISESIAKKYFGNEDPLGGILILDNELACKVSAVFEDMPATGHFRFDILIAMSGLEESRENNFLSNNFNTYLLLAPEANPADLESKFKEFIYKYVGPQAAVAIGGDFTMDGFFAQGNKIEYRLTPIRDIHLHSDRTAELSANGDVTYVWLFGAIALFIVLIACTNFMNLSTARSANRAKEVGIRKVLGSLRSHLVRQFLTESMLLSAAATVVGVLLAYLMLPFFNHISDLDLRLPLNNPVFYVALSGVTVVVGLIAGLYPSFFLSAFQPARVLKGHLALGSRSSVLRGALVVFQFGISIFLIIGTMTVREQLNYILTKDVGFDKEQVIMVSDAYALGDALETFRQEVMRHPAVSHGSISGFIPVKSGTRSDNTFWPHGTDPTEENMVGMQTWAVDHAYSATMGIDLISGRWFSAEFPSDSAAVILNETAAKNFDLGENPVGHRISTFAGNNTDGTIDRNSAATYEVVGVVKDFHFESLRETISPLGFFLRRSPGYISFRFEPGKAAEVIALIDGRWKSMANGQPLAYSFLDESFERMYATEEKIGNIVAVFAALAIIIACLGLFALTAFTAEQRAREIGIRKVLGATVTSIMLLLSREFGKLVLIAFAIAAPLAWLAIDWWLSNYMYKVTISAAVFVVAGAFAFLIGWLTMSAQSVRAATADPVKSLKSE